MYALNQIGIPCEKYIRDPLYNFIGVPEVFMRLMDDEIVQRLRWVSQLPLEQLVYPSAQHSRFEHSLGAMHLAMKAAITLCNKSEKKIKEAFEQDEYFKGERLKSAKKNFILAAGLCGLLHDVGHAPFSHTFEQVSIYNLKQAEYHHETVGYLLTKRLIDNHRLAEEIYSKTALKVLNKKKGEKSDDYRELLKLSPVQRILRKLIDGPIDIDKGDYLLRDSYHCGVVYGLYDVDRLWSEIIITDKFFIGTTPKGALEAWSLRLARYKMFKTVYKHHIRNITDALLIEIITETLSKKPESLEKLMPINNNDDILTDEMVNNFIYWTDETLLKTISDLHVDIVEQKIKDFRNRKLFKFTKQCPEFYLSLYPGANEPDNQIKIIKAILKYKKSALSDDKIEFNFIINEQRLPPIFEEEVQSIESGITVMSNSNETKTLAQYLGFDVEKEKIKKPTKKIEIFLREVDAGRAKEVKNAIENILRRVELFS